MQSAPEHDSRRMSLKLFQAISSDLMRSQQASTSTVPPQSVSSDVSMAGSTASMHDDHHLQQHQQGVMGEDLDHIFDDDIESVGEPVALEAASPLVRNGAIPADLAESLLRTMLFGNANTS